MATKGIFPRKDAEFNTYANNSAKYLAENKARLRIADESLTSQANVLKDWNIIFPQSQDRNECTKTVVDNKIALRVQLEDGFRSIYADIPQSLLTAADRNTLNLKKRDAVPTRVRVMDRAPGLEMERIVHLQHTLRFLNPVDTESRDMPKGQRIILQSFAGTANLSDTAIAFGKTDSVSRFLRRIAYTSEDVGKTAYYRAAYVNTRGEQGPWSEVFAAVVA